MKVAFDVHGTLDRSPQMIIIWMKMFRESGHDICIISGPPILEIRKHLNEIHGEFFKDFIQIYSVVDWIKDQGIAMDQNENGSWYCNDAHWWRSKAVMCQEFDIDMIIDNEIRYKKHFPGNISFVHWNSRNFIGA